VEQGTEAIESQIICENRFYQPKISKIRRHAIKRL